jgi:hypothetical protein
VTGVSLGVAVVKWEVWGVCTGTNKEQNVNKIKRSIGLGLNKIIKNTTTHP